LAVDLISRVWITDERTHALRRLTSRRAQLIRQRTRVKNETTASCETLKGGAPVGSQRRASRPHLQGGNLRARHVLVQAAWAAVKTPGPLRAFYQRIRARRGAQIAIVAVARKLAMLCWQLFSTQQDYAYQRPTLDARKLRTLQLRAGEAHATTPPPPALRRTAAAQHAAQERQLAEQAEHAYRRLVADWQATAPKNGAGAAPGRASQGPSSDQAARQAPAPQPAL
jgi:hypothetical protein